LKQTWISGCCLWLSTGGVWGKWKGDHGHLNSSMLELGLTSPSGVSGMFFYPT
jgi:hypothetical protein